MASGYRDRGGRKRGRRPDKRRAGDGAGRTARGPRRDAGRGPGPARVGPGQVRVDGYSTQWLTRGFPWVYRKEITVGAEGRHDGEPVEIVGADGRSRGTGIWSEHGRVAIRRFRPDAGPIDRALLAAGVDAAWRRRRLPPDTTAWRWVHGENDDLPGVRVDVWGPELAIALDSPALGVLLPDLTAALRERMPRARAIWRVARPEGGPDDDEGCGLLWGEPGEGLVEVKERGLRYGVRPGRSHDAGLFCDMRDLRAWLEPHLGDRRVLNLFAHTGAFSVHAAAHGAAEIVTVDLSARYIDRARDNFARNELDAAPHRFMVEDSFAALDRLRRKGERFDLVIADPPSFSHGPRGDWSVKSDLGRLVAACCRVLSPGGWLVVASNHGALSPRDFGRMVQRGALKAGRPLRLLHEGSTPMDFPAALSFPESRYLKCWVLEG